jgi:predicted O-methyltransferase YrrM
MSLENKINSMEGWCTGFKANIISNLTKKIQDNNGSCTAIEIGVFGGRSLLALGYQLNQPSHVFGVDPYSAQESVNHQIEQANINYWSHVDYNKIKNGAFNGIREKQDVISMLVMTSAQASKLFADGLFDVIHLDGNHSEETSCMDVELWFSKLKKGGYWIMDDANWETTQRAINLLKEKGLVEIENYKEWSIYIKQ